MGLLGHAIAGGIEAAGKTAAENFGTAIKYAYMNELQEAQALREEHIAQLRGDINLSHEKYIQSAQDDRETTKYARSVMGYLNGKQVTNADYAAMSEEDQAKVTNDKAYAAGLIQQTRYAQERDKFVGEDATGQPWTQKDVDVFRSTHNGKYPQGFQTFEQAESALKKKHLENEEKKTSAYIGSLGSGDGKPLTEYQRNVLVAKANKMLADAKTNTTSPDGAIADADLDAINFIREKAGMEPVVPIQKEVIPAKKHWYGADTPAMMGWDYVPASQEGKSKGGSSISSSLSNEGSKLSGKPAGRYRVNGQIIKWNGKQVIQ